MKMAFIAVTFSNLTHCTQGYILFIIQYFNILYYFIKIINFCRKYAVQMVRGKTFMRTSPGNGVVVLNEYKFNAIKLC